MSEELDDLLIEQWDAAKRSKKLFVVYRKLFPHETFVVISESQLDARIRYIESMVVDKRKLIANRKRTRYVAIDIMSVNPVYEWWRNTVFLTRLGSSIFFKFAISYMVSYVETYGRSKKD